MSSTVERHGMIDAVAPAEAIRRSYDLSSHVYDWVAAPFERKPKRMGLERLAIRPEENVLEVAVGPGQTFVEILSSVDGSNVVQGVDLSPKMLAKTRRRAERAGLSHFALQQADARQLPFDDETFDVLFNSYMLDLIPLDDMPRVLAEFYRVLKFGGRLGLVNMSKPDAKITWWERLYRRFPKPWVPYALGGCRPVLMEELVREAGFVDVEREYVAHVMPSEVVIGNKRQV